MVPVALLILQNPKLSPSLESYQAHIAAATSALAIGDSTQAKSWLTKAPKAHRGWEWDYLSKECDLSIATVQVGTKSLTKIQCSPDGKTLAVASVDGTVTLLNSSDLSIKTILKGHTNSVFGANFSYDGSKIVTTSRDNSIRLWDVDQGKEIGTIGDHPVTPYDCKLSPDGKKAVSVGWRMHPESKSPVGLIRVWDVENRKMMKSLDYTTHPISSITFSADGSLAYIGTWEYQTAILDMAKMEVVREVTPSEDEGYKAIDWVDLSPDGKTLLTATKDKTAKLYDLESGKQIGSFTHRGVVSTARFADNGTKVITASQDGAIRVFDTKSKALITRYLGHGVHVNCVAVSPDSATAYSVDINGVLKKWSLTEPDGLGFRASTERVWSSVFDPTGNLIASGTNSRTIQVRDSRTAELKSTSPAFGALVVDVAWSPSGTAIAGGSNDGTVRAFTYPAMTPLWQFKGQGQIRATDWSGDGHYVAAGAGGSGVMHVIDAKSGSLMFEHKMAPGILGVAFSPDSKWLAATSAKELLMFDVSSRKPVSRLDKLSSDGYEVAFSPDGNLIAVGGSAGHVEMFATRGLKPLWSHKTSGSQWGLHFSPDGKRLASYGYDFAVHLWEPKSGAHMFAISDLEQQGFDIRFSPDGNRLAYMGGGLIQMISRK